MYTTDRDINKEKTELNNPKGFFRTICDNLNILIIQANSSQAKGRVERGDKTHQDRLIKLMRLKNIANIEEANKYLDEEYIKEHNERFALQITNNRVNNINNAVDAHRKLDDNMTLNDICYVEEIRKLRNDWTVSFKGKWYQLKKESQFHPPTKSIVYVRLRIDGTVGIFYKDHPIKYEEIK
jgi:hypothetical protein